MASPRLSHNLVRERIINMPNDAHDGMFLWVYLMLKELKSCVSVVQVQEVLTKMPKGIEGL